jgi:hypothetical protein
MKQIQTKFFSNENGTLYYETYFTFISENEINLKLYKEIENIILKFIYDNDRAANTNEDKTQTD